MKKLTLSNKLQSDVSNGKGRTWRDAGAQSKNNEYRWNLKDTKYWNRSVLTLGVGGVAACTGRMAGMEGSRDNLYKAAALHLRAGRAGTESRGGEGGDSMCSPGYGAGGAGGGMQLAAQTLPSD
ncbi:hypothetical protein OS493_039600 [Desmophyllum pertusum]|uniref:Uncharacterized protein n=1 Tax=Desmophyllum pertusum TaxID=174260 RepID=A0A9W9YTV5_9CNID|nr:hypothetical protein OS493_039600 [Desmophyllum pertusum]